VVAGLQERHAPLGHFFVGEDIRLGGALAEHRGVADHGIHGLRSFPGPGKGRRASCGRLLLLFGLLQDLKLSQMRHGNLTIDKTR